MHVFILFISRQLSLKSFQIRPGLKRGFETPKISSERLSYSLCLCTCAGEEQQGAAVCCWPQKAIGELLVKAARSDQRKKRLEKFRINKRKVCKLVSLMLRVYNLKNGWNVHIDAIKKTAFLLKQNFVTRHCLQRYQLPLKTSLSGDLCPLKLMRPDVVHHYSWAKLQRSFLFLFNICGFWRFVSIAF